MGFVHNIVLIGMPGSGKSSIGFMLSKKLQTTFYDMDLYIEEREQKSIPELFQFGEDYFRQLESKAVRELYQKRSNIIATGGGIVLRPENMSLLCETGIIIYIDRPIEMILESSDLTSRPLLAKDNSRIFALHQERKHLYEAYCQHRIMNNGSLETAVEQILTTLRTCQ